jgi:hypothetical protein
LPSPSKPPRRGGKPKACNAKRRNREWIRVYHSAERVAFIAALPCIITGKTPCENVHIIGGGMGRKASSRLIVPMIPALHRELHAIGTLSFCRKYGVALVGEASRIERLWLSHCGVAATGGQL